MTIAFDLPASGSQIDEADAIAIDEAGNIIVGGLADAGPSGGSDFAVARLLPNGMLDHNFDADGRATFAFDLGASNSDQAYDMIRQRDGKIVLVGDADTGSGSTSNLDTAIARLLPDGSPIRTSASAARCWCRTTSSRAAPMSSPTVLLLKIPPGG